MATIVSVVQFTGTADEEDRRAFQYVVEQENARRAALTPPGTPLPASTVAERRSSYELIATPKVLQWHLSNIRESDVATLAQVRARWPIATDAQRAAALAALPPLP